MDFIGEKEPVHRRGRGRFMRQEFERGIDCLKDPKERLTDTAHPETQKEEELPEVL